MVTQEEGEQLFEKAIVIGVSDGEVPIKIDSKTMVPNLNAEFLQGKKIKTDGGKLTFQAVEKGAIYGGIKTFTTSFSTPPIVLVSAETSSGDPEDVAVAITYGSVTTTQFSYMIKNCGSVTFDLRLHWFAVEL